VKIENSIAIANIKQYSGRGRFSPCIFDPNHNNKVGQNTTIINGVPDPAKNKKGVDSTIKHDASSETLLLNQRLSSSINRNPNSNPTITLGNFMLYVDKPNMTTENFCNSLYGKSTKSPFRIPFLPR